MIKLSDEQIRLIEFCSEMGGPIAGLEKLKEFTGDEEIEELIFLHKKADEFEEKGEKNEELNKILRDRGKAITNAYGLYTF